MATWKQTESTPDWKPAKRHRASQAEWSDINEAFATACCVHCGIRYQSLHHILPRSQGGGDLIVNLAPLCGTGTTGCHGLLETHAPGWERVAASVRQYVIVDNERRRYQEEHAGESFTRRYPVLPNTDPRFLSDRDLIFRHQFGESEAVEGFEAA